MPEKTKLALTPAEIALLTKLVLSVLDRLARHSDTLRKLLDRADALRDLLALLNQAAGIQDAKSAAIELSPKLADELRAIVGALPVNQVAGLVKKLY